MKRIFILIILTLTIQYSFGQACGIYRINYVGSIKFESLKIEKIKLPTIQFLHGLIDENSEKSFVEIELINNRINIELNSHLTSHLYQKSESLLRFYKTKRKTIPFIIIVIEDEVKKEIRIELTWSNIQVTQLKDDGFGNLFQLNLNEVDIK